MIKMVMHFHWLKKVAWDGVTFKRTTHLAHFLDTPLVSLSHVPRDCQWEGCLGVEVATPPDLAMHFRKEEV